MTTEKNYQVRDPHANRGEHVEQVPESLVATIIRLIHDEADSDDNVERLRAVLQEHLQAAYGRGYEDA